MNKSSELYLFDELFRQKGFSALCGIDEAGRGPLAGPVCAAAVILDPTEPLEGLDDSKKISPRRREILFSQITAKALAFGVGWADEKEIDQLNILQATFLAMHRAVEQMGLNPDLLLVDGNRDPGFSGIETVCVVGGDRQSASVAAASILAKVSRDRYMEKMEEAYPGYGFAKHKGYGTKDHRQAILEKGPCPIHRESFLGKILSGGKK